MPTKQQAENLSKGRRFTKNDEYTRNAGRKSGEARRLRRTAKEIASMFAESDPDIEGAKQYLQKLGVEVENEEITAYMLAMAKSIIAPALSGDRDAFLKWAQLKGEDVESMRDKEKYKHEIAKIKLLKEGQGNNGDQTSRIIQHENGDIEVIG